MEEDPFDLDDDMSSSWSSLRDTVMSCKFQTGIAFLVIGYLILEALVEVLGVIIGKMF
ncbi:hypothetical protein DSO57_1013115 [Entomophthora muscae]|uniref:Uncharacterized protein n=1 Tax=Entomophthora muscae TaxID=34485 RepID=A0ACC2U4I0_9FUNG|nr:hypothetical protein DSO57_1013115 [Entomophthora muscae]